MGTPTVADRLAAPIAALTGGALPLRIRAWDGSEAGPGDGPTVVVRSRRALRHLVWRPDELGVARAYVAGDLDVDGDLDAALGQLRAFGRTHGRGTRISAADRLRVLAAIARLGGIGPRPEPPASEARLRGRRHTRTRDSAVVAHHYDLSNEFYELLLDDEHLAYSCAYWDADSADMTVADAQRSKLDLVCHKLAIRPGTRLLDVGCGWGSLSVHAARHFGARVTGVTLSREQLELAGKRVADLGLTDRVDLRLQDYRDIDDGPYDVAASIEMGEHVGAEQYPAFVAGFHRLLRPGGRLLIQQMSRRGVNPGGGPFIESYIAPDMHMRPVGETVALLEAGGFEVRDVEAMREHYARTIRAWHRTFEARWDDVVALVGMEVARVWRLYLVGAALSFEDGTTGVDQILGVRADDGRSEFPPTRAWLAPGA